MSKNNIRAGVLVGLWCWNLCDITVRSTTAPAAEIVSIEPFTGDFAEGFESIPPGGIIGLEPHLAGPLCILDGRASLTATHSTDTTPLYVWSSVGGFTLGRQVTAIPFDGKQGVHLVPRGNTDPVGRIDFGAPVSQFGAYWLHAQTSERAGPVTISFHDASDEVIGTRQFDKDFSTGGDSQWFGWSSETPISAVEFTGFWAAMDGVQIRFPPDHDGRYTPCVELSQRQTIIDRSTVISEFDERYELGVTITDGADQPTIVELIDGGVISERFLAESMILETARLEVAGGALMGPVSVHDEAKLELSSGSISPRGLSLERPAALHPAIRVLDFSSLEVTGGVVMPDLFSGSVASVLVEDSGVAAFVDGTTWGGFASRAVVARDTASIQVTGGKIFGETSAILVGGASTIHIAGGEIFADEHIGLTVSGSSVANISGGTMSGDNRSLLVDQSGTALISGGRFTADGVSVLVADEGTINVSDGFMFGDSFALQLKDVATARITGGEFRGDSSGIRLSDDSRLILEGGTIAGDSRGLFVDGHAIADLFGGIILGDRAALQLTGAATARITGGEFRAENSVIRLSDDSRLELQGGTIKGRDGPGLFVDGHAVADVFGGIILADPDEAPAVVVAGSGIANIRGGVFEREGSRLQLLANDAATINVIGTNLSISDGILTGTLQDGNPIEVRVQGNVQIQPPQLEAGDADQNKEFDQLDIVQVSIAGKYLSGQAATWGEGDWDGAPGGAVGNPPAGNGLFDQGDIVAALLPDHYRTGPYAALKSGGSMGDGQTSLVYDAGTGQLSVEPPVGKELTSVNITSAGNKFTGDRPAALDGAFDNFAADNVFKATFGGSFGSISLGDVLPTGMSADAVSVDLSAIGSLAGGGDLGDVDLIYFPEPSSLTLALLSLSSLGWWRRRKRVVQLSRL